MESKFDYSQYWPVNWSPWRNDMKQCKCEHWQECQICAPTMFDADGKRKPPEPTPLEACRAELEACRAELDTMREVLALHEVGSAYAHRMAVLLECALLNPAGTWNDAYSLLDEYYAACRNADANAGTADVHG